MMVEITHLVPSGAKPGILYNALKMLPHEIAFSVQMLVKSKFYCKNSSRHSEQVI